MASRRNMIPTGLKTTAIAMMPLILLVGFIGNPLDNFMTVIDTQFFASRRSSSLSKSQMKPTAQTIVEKICDFCRRPMTAKQYEDALKASQKERNTEFSAERKRLQEETQRQLDQQQKHYENILNEQKESISKDLEKLYSDRLKITEQTKEKFYKQDLDQKDKEIKALNDQQTSKFERMLDDKNLQIESQKTELGRVNKKLEDLQRGLSHGSSELKGEAGERSLKQILTEAFQNDFFKKQTKGIEEPDLIQKIKENSEFLEIIIGYDNKEGKYVTKADIKKAKQYQKRLKTKYILIVSKNITEKKGGKNINVLITERDGILLVDPKIVVVVATQIRKAIIEISKITKSREDRETKEAKVYDYVLSPEFSGVIEKFQSIYSKNHELRDAEEKKHQTWWKERADLEEQLRIATNDLSSRIDSIIQNQSDEETEDESVEEDSA